MKEWKDTNPSSPFTVTYYFTYGNTGKRLSELHTHHSHLTCFSEGTRVTGKVLQCLTRLPLFSERGQGWAQDWFILLKKKINLPQASLVAQMVKNLVKCGRPGFDPWVGKDPLEESMATHSSILAWRIPMDRGTWWAIVHTVTKSQTWLKPCSTHTVIWKDIFFYMLHEGGNFKICYILFFENVCWINALLQYIQLWSSYMYVFRYEFLLTATKILASENEAHYLYTALKYRV